MSLGMMDLLVFLLWLKILGFGLMVCWMLTLPLFPRLMVMLLLLDRDLLVYSLSSIVFGLRLVFCSWRIGFILGSQSRFFVLVWSRFC